VRARAVTLVVALLAAGLVGLACKRHTSAGRACTPDAACPSGEVCEYAPGLGGKGRRPGVCRPAPASCGDEPYSPVCGCDGKTYESACVARTAGVDVSVSGGCKQTLAGWAPCGGRYCDVRTSYCEIFLSDVVDPPTDYFCRPLPPSCAPRDGIAPTCDCFPAGTRCASFCGPLATAPGAPSGFHLTCQGTRPPSR
jgi:hypothetical protein